MARVATAALLCGALSCHPPWPDTAIPEGDADTDTDGDADHPPDELCSADWGWVESTMTEARDGNVHYVTPGYPFGLIFEVAGQLDLCEQGCSASWLTEYFITDSKAYDTVISLPLRLDEGDLFYAYFYVEPPKALPDSDEHCWIETSAGKRWMALFVRS